MSGSTLDVEGAVRRRYSESALSKDTGRCCSVKYPSRYLEAIPEEILAKDFGCGDPSRHVREGDTVLDLGSGGGKICFIAAQMAGPRGRVIGVDMNEDMLALARGATPEVARRVGYANVEFRRGRIQDLKLDLDLLGAWLADHPVGDVAGLSALNDAAELLRREHPLVPDASVDLVISNCVLNLVRDDHKSQLIGEIHRVLRPGGRIGISDIVSEEEAPEDLKRDPELWAGCVTGAFRRDRLERELKEAGFRDVAVERSPGEPFAVLRGIEFYSATILGRKEA